MDAMSMESTSMESTCEGWTRLSTSAGSPSQQSSIENGRSLAGMKPSGMNARDANATSMMLATIVRLFRLRGPKHISRGTVLCLEILPAKAEWRGPAPWAFAARLAADARESRHRSSERLCRIISSVRRRQWLPDRRDRVSTRTGRGVGREYRSSDRALRHAADLEVPLGADCRHDAELQALVRDRCDAERPRSRGDGGLQCAPRQFHRPDGGLHPGEPRDYVARHGGGGADCPFDSAQPAGARGRMAASRQFCRQRRRRRCGAVACDARGARVDHGRSAGCMLFTLLPW